MSWFSHTEHKDIPLKNRSLAVSFANLLDRLVERDIRTPEQVYREVGPKDEQLDWWSIVGIPEGIELDEMSETHEWPTTNHAIVKQRRIDHEAAGMVDHYSLVADQRAMSIVDSLDGTIKSASIYGSILGWASYSYKHAVEPETADEPDVVDESGIHVVKAGENVWDIARAYNVPAANIIAENELEDPRHVPVGTELFIPDLSHRRDESAMIRYELLEPVRKMHVSREEGAKKWSFGGVKKWDDLYSSGRVYPKDTNLTIVAIAHVPVGGETAAYYLDAVSLGDYDTTGLPRYTNGFNWQHLEEGHIPEEVDEYTVIEAVADIPPTAATVTQIASDALAEDDRPDMVADEDKELIIKPATDTYKHSFRFLTDDKKAVEYMFNEALTVFEMDGRLGPKRVGKFDLVRLIGTFEKDGVMFGRAAVRGYWYGVPMDKVSPEDEVYNTDVDLPTRIAMRGHLSSAEIRMVWMAKTAARYRKLVGLVKRKK